MPAPEPEAAKAEPSPPAPETPEPPPAKTDLTIPLVIYGGLGASAVLAGTALILYKSANDKAAGICPSGVNCTRDDILRHQGYVNDARDARTLAYVGLGVAGASLITGGVIALLRSNREGKPEQAAFSAGPTFAPGGFGGAVEGPVLNPGPAVREAPVPSRHTDCCVARGCGANPTRSVEKTRRK